MAISDTLSPRRRKLENSAATALIAASMPPIPSPVKMRQTDRSYTPFARVAMIMPTAMTMRQPSKVRRRPSLSATPPSKTEPKPMPISSMESTKPNAARSIPHSRAMPGEAKLMASTSKPSSAFSPTVIAITAIWIRLIGLEDRISRGSAEDMVSSLKKCVSDRMPYAAACRAPRRETLRDGSRPDERGREYSSGAEPTRAAPSSGGSPDDRAN